jgi:hypothetical protein
MPLLAEGVAQTGGVRWVQDHLVSAELHRVRSRAGAVVAAEPGGVACEGQIVLAAEISVGYDFARRVLATDWGKQLYLKRQGTVEPVFGQIKSNRGANRFQRRGRISRQIRMAAAGRHPQPAQAPPKPARNSLRRPTAGDPMLMPGIGSSCDYFRLALISPVRGQP